ncbi:hypothetical protein MMC18_007312 [Xylographa bjoerkii]|nr:hypothetical protein [Xylographa bjoerkii]
MAHVVKAVAALNKESSAAGSTILLSASLIGDWHSLSEGAYGKIVKIAGEAVGTVKSVEAGQG